MMETDRPNTIRKSWGPQCWVINCFNFKYSKPEGVTFHKFPRRDKSPERHKLWTWKCMRSDSSPTNYSVVCSVHFSEEQIDRTGQIVRLRSGAVPDLVTLPPRPQVKTDTPRFTMSTRSGKRFSRDAESSKTSTPAEKTTKPKLQARRRKTGPCDIPKENENEETDSNKDLVSSAGNPNVSQFNSTPAATPAKKRRSRKILGPPPSPGFSSEFPEITNVNTTPEPIATSSEAKAKFKGPWNRKILREGPPPSLSPPPHTLSETRTTPTITLINTSRVPVHFNGKDVLDYINVSRAAKKRKAQILVDHSYAVTESAKELKQKLLDYTGTLMVTKKKLKVANECNSRLKKRLSTLVMFIDSLRSAEKNSGAFQMLDDLETLMLEEPWVKS